MKRLLFIIVCLSCCFMATAQEIDTLYFTTYGHSFSPSEKQGASFYQLIPRGDGSLYGRVKCYYLTGEDFGYFTYMEGEPDGPFELLFKNGQVQYKGTYAKTQIVEIEEEWYENGQIRARREYFMRPEGSLKTPKIKLLDAWDSLGKQTVTDGTGYFEEITAVGKLRTKGSYKDGWKFGLWEGFRKDGAKWYEETYKSGAELISGTSYDEEGKAYEYTILEEPSSFPGELKGWVKFLKKNFKYPKKARRQGTEGFVYLTFIVGKEGNVRDAEVIQGIGPYCDAEALRVINLSPRWIPGKQRGQYVNSRMQIAIRFKLR